MMFVPPTIEEGYHVYKNEQHEPYKTMAGTSVLAKEMTDPVSLIVPDNVSLD